MTTTVRILIQGNKACSVLVEGSGGGQSIPNVLPGTWVESWIHGDAKLTVQEVGDFLPTGKLIWSPPDA
jgi:hypothetical protein